MQNTPDRAAFSVFPIDAGNDFVGLLVGANASEILFLYLGFAVEGEEWSFGFHRVKFQALGRVALVVLAIGSHVPVFTKMHSTIALAASSVAA